MDTTTPGGEEIERALRSAAGGVAERDAAIMTAFEQGMRAYKIAGLVGLTRQGVHKIIQKNGGRVVQLSGRESELLRHALRAIVPGEDIEPVPHIARLLSKLGGGDTPG